MIDTIKKESVMNQAVKKEDDAENNFCRATCPIEYTMFNIAGKWKLVLLWHIYDKEIIRYGELKKCLNNITHKMLSNQLKDLVSYGLVHKEMYHQVPPKVEYSLTKKGKSLIPMLHLMRDWGLENMVDEVI
jgi:DNA-binding HxlR family transcriptional regulator